jgi:hypothetical protein
MINVTHYYYFTLSDCHWQEGISVQNMRNCFTKIPHTKVTQNSKYFQKYKNNFAKLKYTYSGSLDSKNINCTIGTKITFFLKHGSETMKHIHRTCNNSRVKMEKMVRIGIFLRKLGVIQD